jgi:hypothetical protein
MTLIPAGPTLDAAIRWPAPADGPRFSIRAVAPPACAL